MADTFAAPEGLRNVPNGLWPSPCDQTLPCGHAVAETELIGYVHGDHACEDCVTDAWDWDDGHGGPF